MQGVNMIINTHEHGKIIINNVKSVSWEEDCIVIQHESWDQFQLMHISFDKFDTFSFEKQETLE